LSNRERASLVIFCFFIVLALKSSEVRDSFVNFIKSIKGTIYFFIIYLIVFILELFILYKVNLWDFNQIKDSIFWFLTVAIIMPLRYVNSKNKKKIIETHLKDLITIVAILEFIIGIYTFSFGTEIIFLLLISTVNLIKDFSQDNKRKKMMEKVKNYIFFILFIYIFYRLSLNLKSFFNGETINNFFIIPILSIGYLPFQYIVFIYFELENYYLKFKVVERKNKKINLLKTLKVLKKSNFSLKKLLENKKLNLQQCKTMKEFEDRLAGKEEITEDQRKMFTVNLIPFRQQENGLNLMKEYYGKNKFEKIEFDKNQNSYKIQKSQNYYRDDYQRREFIIDKKLNLKYNSYIGYHNKKLCILEISINNNRPEKSNEIQSELFKYIREEIKKIERIFIIDDYQNILKYIDKAEEEMNIELINEVREDFKNFFIEILTLCNQVRVRITKEAY